MTTLSMEAKEKYIQHLEMDSIKAKMLAETEKLIQKKKIIQALKESHRDLTFSLKIAEARMVTKDEEYAACKNASQRDACLCLKLNKEKEEIQALEKEIDSKHLDLDLIQDNLKLLKYQARMVVAELQFMAD